MYEPVQTCTRCGAGLTLDDLRAPNCKYCGTVFPHKAQAAQHAELAGQVMNQMMAQQAQIQDQWRAAFGAGPMPPTGPMGPAMGPMGPMGPGMPPPPGAPGSPYASPQAIAAAHMMQVGQVQQQVARSVSRTTTIVMIVVGLSIVLTIGGVLASVLMAR